MPRPPASDDDAGLRWDDIDDPSWADATRRPEVADDQQIGAEDRLGADDLEGPGLDARGDSAAQLAEPAVRSVAPGLVTAVGAVVYLAYSIAWIIGVGRLPLSGPTLVLEVLYQFAEFLAIIASGLWFGATIVLTRGRLARRAGWLALGSLVLLPWPFVLGVVV